jgi:stage II sporulation protein P
MKKALSLLLVMLILLPFPVLAKGETQDDPESVFEIFDEQGGLITYYCGTLESGDEYISEDNHHFKVTSVDTAKKTGVAKNLGMYEMPDVSWLDAEASLPVSAAGKQKKIAIYCTHTDESYEPSEGSSSKKGDGGIIDVASQLKTELEKLGVSVEQSTTLHEPHDSGAYRRSRQTAMKLVQTGPDAIFDIHRDGIPNPKEYNTKVAGEDVSKIRLEVGRSNQNATANKKFAAQLKAVADKVYPGLVKDIFIGKGTYNQDLSPRSMLLEFGTHTTSKERAETSTSLMANVIYKALYGGVTGSAGAASDVGPNNNTAANNQDTGTPSVDDNSGSGSGILWVVGVFVAGLVIFALIATGSKQGTVNKLKRNVSEMTGGLFGKKPQK